MQLTSILVYIYGALVIVGGGIGFLKAGSLPSLIAGVTSGLLLLVAGYGIGSRAVWGLPLALTLIGALLIFFSVRYFGQSPRVFMPGGLMSVLSLLALVGVLLTARR